MYKLYFPWEKKRKNAGSLIFFEKKRQMLCWLNKNVVPLHSQNKTMVR